MEDKEIIAVTILAYDRVVWQGEARLVSSENSEGAFDILPNHARFITLISNAPLQIEEKTGFVRTFTFQSAVLFFQDNTARVYVHHGGKTDSDLQNAV